MTQSLKERLLKVEGSTGGGMDIGNDVTCWYRNPDGPEAVREIERLEELLDEERDRHGNTFEDFRQMAIRADRAEARVAELEAGLRKIIRMKPEPIGETGFQVGPQALFDAAKRHARAVLKSQEQNDD